LTVNFLDTRKAINIQNLSELGFLGLKDFRI